MGYTEVNIVTRDDTYPTFWQEGTVERDAEVKFRRRITGANVSR